MTKEPFDLNADFLGRAMFPAILSLPSFVQKNMLQILENQGVTNFDPDSWHNIKISINFYKELVEKFGPNTVYDLGKAIIDNAAFPPGIDSLESFLSMMDVSYNMNHRNGYLGFYKMVSHDTEEKKIIMQCYNPYPCDFDRGLLTSMARKFKTGVRVMVDESKPSRKKGDLESWYIISYR